MEQTKEHKERNKGGRPKKEATEKLKYRIAVKMMKNFCHLCRNLARYRYCNTF